MAITAWIKGKIKERHLQRQHLESSTSGSSYPRAVKGACGNVGGCLEFSVLDRDEICNWITSLSSNACLQWERKQTSLRQEGQLWIGKQPGHPALTLNEFEVRSPGMLPHHPCYAM